MVAHSSWLAAGLLVLVVFFPVLGVAQDRVGDFLSPSLPSIVSPLDGERVSETILVMARPSREGDSLFLVVGDERVVFPSDTYSVSLDSRRFSNGEQSFIIQSCVRDSCVDVSRRVIVDNPPSDVPSRKRRSSPPVVDEGVVSSDPVVLHTVSFSGWFGLSNFSGRSGSFSSGRGENEVVLPAGDYSVFTSFSEGPLSSLSLDGVSIDASDTLFVYRENIAVAPFTIQGRTFAPDYSFSFSSPFSMSGGLASFPLGESLAWFYCGSFDYRSGSCRVSWSRASREGRSFTSAFQGSSGLFARVSGGYSPGDDLPPVPISLASVPGEYFASSPKGRIGPLDSSAYSFFPGSYDLVLVPYSGPFSLVQVSSAELDHAGTFLDLTLVDSSERDTPLRETWRVVPGYVFDSSSWSLVPSRGSLSAEACVLPSGASTVCDSPWVPFHRFSQHGSPFLVRLTFGEVVPEDVNVLVADPFLLETITWAKEFNTNKRFFKSVLARDSLRTLNALFSDIEVGVECLPEDLSSRVARITEGVSNSSRDSDVLLESVPPAYFDLSSPSYLSGNWELFWPDTRGWRQREDVVECEGVSMVHSFSSLSPGFPSNVVVLGSEEGRVKETLTLRNLTDSPQTRLVGIRLVTPYLSLGHSSSRYDPSSEYSLIPVPSDLSSGDGSIRFLQENGSSPGAYDVSDFIAGGFSPRVLVHRLGSSLVLETFLEVSLSPGEEKVLDPTYNLSRSLNFWMRFSGGAVDSFLGDTEPNLGNAVVRIPDPGFKVVNVDNESHADDILITSPFVDVLGRADAGAIYLIQDVDTNLFGAYDFNAPNAIASASWYGSMAGDYIGRSYNGGDGAQLVDLDRNGYANDLIIHSSSDFGASNAGSLYVIYDVDRKFGIQDLNTSTTFRTRWDGTLASEFFPYTASSGPAVMVVDSDNNGYANDLLVTSATSSGLYNGSVFLMKDANQFSGILSIGSASSYSAAWQGGGIIDALGSITDGLNGVLIGDMDGNGYANDLLIGGGLVDIGAGDTGALYLVSDIDRKSGALSLGSSSNYTARWGGGAANDQLGEMLSAGNGIQLLDSDGNGIFNDVIVSAVQADVNGSTDTGAVYFIKDVNTWSGNFSLATSSGYSARWYADWSSESLGLTQGSGNGVLIANLDGDPVANDLILRGFGINYASRLNTGAVYVIDDVNAWLGDFNMGFSTSYTTAIFGSANLDLMGSSYFSGEGLQVVNIDQNLFPNDFIIAASEANNGGEDRGSIYFVKDLNRFTGTGNVLDLNNVSDFWLRIDGGADVDSVGNSLLSGTAAQLGDVDGNGYANDLLLSVPFADTNSRQNNGALYLIKNVDKKSGIKVLNTAADYDVAWYGGDHNSYLGGASNSGQGVRLINADRNRYANDVLINSPAGDMTDKNAGVVSLLHDIGSYASGQYDLNNAINSYRQYVGASMSDYLGGAFSMADGVAWTSVDGDGYSNDLLISAPRADINSKADAGVLYVLTNQSFGGSEDYSFVLSLPSSGCTVGKGNISGGTICEKGHVEATSTTQYKVNPQGQSSSVPFFVFDNQSSTQSDFNVVLDLNAALPAGISMKSGTHYNKWFLHCNGDTVSGCVEMGDNNVSIGRLAYSAGSLDLNIWLWGDFVGISSGTSVDRNVMSGATSWGV